MHNLYPDENFSDLMEKASKCYARMNNFYRSNREKIDGETVKNDIDESTVEQLKALGYM